MKPLNNESGMILLTVLMLMFIGTLLGVISMNSATVEVQLAGNDKKVSTSFAAAEGGIDLAIPIIEQSLASGKLDPASITFNNHSVFMDTAGDQLYKEISDSSYANDPDDAEVDPDIRIPDIGDGVQVWIDIDRLFSQVIAGGALEFAMGYEGAGTGAAGGGIATYYRINSAGGR